MDSFGRRNRLRPRSGGWKVSRYSALAPTGKKESVLRNEWSKYEENTGEGGEGVRKKERIDLELKRTISERWAGEDRRRRRRRNTRELEGDRDSKRDGGSGEEAGESGKKGKRDIFTAAIYKMGYDQLNSPILRGTDEGMRYIGCTSSTRRTDARRTLKYVLIILACRLLLRPSSSSFSNLSPLRSNVVRCVRFRVSVFVNCHVKRSTFIHRRWLDFPMFVVRENNIGNGGKR